MSAYNKFRVTSGSYNWADPRKKQIAIRFSLRPDAPAGLYTSYVTRDLRDGEELPEFESALDAAKYVLDYCRACLYNGDLSYIQALYNYLASSRDGVPMELLDFRAELIEKRDELARRLKNVELGLASVEDDIKEYSK